MSTKKQQFNAITLQTISISKKQFRNDNHELFLHTIEMNITRYDF